MMVIAMPAALFRRFLKYVFSANENDEVDSPVPIALRMVSCHIYTVGITVKVGRYITIKPGKCLVYKLAMGQDTFC